MKLLIVSDAWYPQVNGVVRTLSHMRDGLIARGWDVRVLGPSGLTVACPTYPEIRLTLAPTQAVVTELEEGLPDYIHIATEGPLGRAMRRICLLNSWPFTTSFHTRFPEYVKARFGIPRRWTYSYLRHFHRPAARVLVPTPSVSAELEARGFINLKLWGRGVDLKLFHPSRRKPIPFEYPVQLYVGRLAVEKNVEAFLKLETSGTKVVVGDGPARHRLQKEFPDAVFMGQLYGERLAEIYASADVMVFPSLTDTFGLVILESLASGTPVAAFPASGPKDVLAGTQAGVLSENLGEAVRLALQIDRDECRRVAEQHSWSHSLDVFSSSMEAGISAYNVQGGFSPSSSSGIRFSSTNLSHSLVK